MNDQQIHDLYRRCYLDALRPQDEDAAKALDGFMYAYGVYRSLVKVNFAIKAREQWLTVRGQAQKVSDCFHSKRILGDEL